MNSTSGWIGPDSNQTVQIQTQILYFKGSRPDAMMLPIFYRAYQVFQFFKGILTTPYSLGADIIIHLNVVLRGENNNYKNKKSSLYQ